MTIAKYLNMIQEGYLLSDKNISVDLAKFESGESNKLLVVGLIGSGKTTLGKYLAKEYKAKSLHTDKCISWSLDEHPPNEKQFKEYMSCVKQMISSNTKSVVEGVGPLGLFNMNQKDVLNHPMIIIGKSVTASSLQAILRNRKIKESQFWKLLFTQTKMNLTLFQKQISAIRKARVNMPGAIVKEFKVPKL